jgi:CrcB protein
VLWLAIACGGAIGAAARHGLNVALHTGTASRFPWSTFAANALGCLAIGLVAGLVASTRLHLGEAGRAVLVVGVLGGFTTFSAFGLDTFTLARGGQNGLAVLNVAGQLLVALSAVWLGYAAGAWRP